MTMVSCVVLLRHWKPAHAPPSCATEDDQSNWAQGSCPRGGVKLTELPHFPLRRAAIWHGLATNPTTGTYMMRSWLPWLFHTLECFHKDILNFKPYYQRNTSGKCANKVKMWSVISHAQFLFQKFTHLFCCSPDCGWNILLPITWMSGVTSSNNTKIQNQKPLNKTRSQ